MSENSKVQQIKELRQKLNKSIVEDNAGAKTPQKPKIQKVPASLRDQENSEKYYEPRWMSIGPIHHGNPKYKLAEEYKITLAAKFIRGRGFKSCEDLYSSISDGMAGLEQRYSEETIGDQPEFIKWLLLIDGCAIMQFMHGCTGGEGGDLNMKNDQVAFTQHDIFLLENQIPFRVLKLLILAKPEDSEKLKKAVLAFLSLNAMAPPKYQRPFTAELLDRDPDHLLHLLLLALVEQPEKVGKSNPDNNPAPGLGVDDHHETAQKKTEGSSSDQISIQIPSKEQHKAKGTRKNRYREQQSFRSVTDLKSAGINLEPSDTSSLSAVRFSSHGFASTLYLPPLIVDDLTGSKFMNLIAYEMCPDNTTTSYEVTSYISFLDSLIDYPADVKELRSARVLHNLLGCDKYVAQLFNKIGTDLVPDPRVYEGVIDKIEKHHKKRLKTWIAQVLNDHFSTPWTIVTFLAAVLALGLAIIDTWLNIKGDKSKRD